MIGILFAAALVVQGDDPVQRAASHDYCAMDQAALTALSDAAAMAPEDEPEIGPAVRSLQRAGANIALVARSERDCRRTFERGRQAYEQARERAERQLGGSGRSPSSDDVAIAAIQARLAQLWRADQAGRRAYLATRTEDTSGADFWAHRLATAQAVQNDAQSTAYLRDILTEWDWIDAHRFGSSTASQAWIIAQHADDHPDFQAEALQRMEPYLEGGGVRPADYAHLWDRVAVNTGQPQRYGTQLEPGCPGPGGAVVPRPLSDPDNVDALRAAMGLEPLADYLRASRSGRC